MDPTLLGGLLAIAGGAVVAGLGLLGQYAQGRREERRWRHELAERNQKQEDEAAETRRRELRDAYSEFFAVASKLIDGGRDWLLMLRDLHNVRTAAAHEVFELGGDSEAGEAAFNDAVSDEHLKESHERRLAFVAASTDVAAKGSVVAMLEDDTAYGVEQFLDAPIAPPRSADDFDRFEHELMHHRQILRELRSLMRGRFAAHRPSTALAVREKQ